MSIFTKKITGTALKEIQEFNRIVNAEMYKAQIVMGNTALVPNGKKVAAQMFAVANLLKGQLDGIVAQRLTEAGIPEGQKVNLDLETGEIINAVIQTS